MQLKCFTCINVGMYSFKLQHQTLHILLSSLSLETFIHAVVTNTDSWGLRINPVL